MKKGKLLVCADFELPLNPVKSGTLFVAVNPETETPNP